MTDEVKAEDAEAKTAIFEALGVEEETKKDDAPYEEAPVKEDKPKVTDDEPYEKDVDDTEVEEVVEDSPYTDVEQEALKLGWKPDGVPGRKKKSAEEWMDDYSLYKKINDLGKQVQEKNSLLENVAKHFEKVEEAAYKQAKKEFDQQVEELRQLAAETIESGDIPAEDVIAAYENDLKMIQSEHDAEMNKIKKGEEPKPAPQTKDDIMKTLSEPEQAFVNKHEKLLFSQKPADIAVQAFIVNRNNELAQEGLSPEDRITALENDLADVFPKQFGAAKKIKPKSVSKVESSSISGKADKGYSLKNLAPDQRELYDYFVEQGVPADELLAQFQLVIEDSK